MTPGNAGFRRGLVMVTAALPPQLDGIGDYTARLAAEIAKGDSGTETTIIVGHAGADSVPGVEIIHGFDARRPRTVQRLEDHMPKSGADWLLLQYNPFSYGRWGLNLHLPSAFKRAADQGKARRALMVHEPFVEVLDWKHAVMTTWQRLQLWLLGRGADVLFFSTEVWANRFRRWFPSRKVIHLPVGSNIPQVRVSPEEVRLRLGIPEARKVIGMFGTMHNSRSFAGPRNAIGRAVNAGFDVCVLYIGPHGRAVRAALPGVVIVDSGCLAPQEASRRFAAMDVYFASYEDGVSTRRTTLMAALEHGVPSICTGTEATDTVLKHHAGRAFMLADHNDPHQFGDFCLKSLYDIPFAKELGRNGRHLFQQCFSWEVISSRLLSELMPSALVS